MTSKTQRNDDATDERVAPTHSRLKAVGVPILGFLAIVAIFASLTFSLSTWPVITASLTAFLFASKRIASSFDEFDDRTYRTGAGGTFLFLALVGSAFVLVGAVQDLFIGTTLISSTADVLLAVIGIQRQAETPVAKGYILLAILLVYFKIGYSANLRYWRGVHWLVERGWEDEDDEDRNLRSVIP